MEHGAYKEMLSALLDGELHGAEREAALAHLETCADCRAYFEELTALRAALDDLEEFDAPEGFAAGVMARLRAEGEIMRPRADGAIAQPRAENASSTSNPVKKRTAWRGVAALAACAAVVLLAVRVLPNALKMGGSSAAADRVSPATAQATPTEAPTAPAGDAAENGAPAPAPQAPDPGYGYAYTDGKSSGDAEDVALESAQEEDYRAVDADLPAAANDRVANGAASGTTIATTGGEQYATADKKPPIVDTDEVPMVPLSRPEAWDEEYPVLTLTGADAESWLAEHGWQGESGAWYVEAKALRALPETVMVLYSELSEDYDGSVLVELWLVEPSAGEAEP